MRPMAATKIITNIGKGAGFVAHRRDGNVNAQHPSMIAIKPREIRQNIGVGPSNKANSGGRIEPFARQTKTFSTEAEAKQFAKEMLSNKYKIVAGTLLSADQPARRFISGSQLYRWIEEEEG